MSGRYALKYQGLCGGSRILAWLIGANVAVSLVAMLAGLVGVDLAGVLALPSALSAYAVRPWTIVSYMVTQFSFLHLLVNVLWLFWFGRLVLNEVSQRQLGLCYLCGGLAGGAGYLASSALGAESGAYLCGSSAAVMGVMAMAGVLMGNRELRFMLLGTVKVKWVALVCLVLTLAGTKGATAVSVAHLGGVAGGLLYAYILKYKGERAVKINSGEILEKVRRQIPRPERERRPEKVAEAVRGRFNDHTRLDELLDKIRVSGYSSLSDTERRELDALSKRL